ncbi:MAG: Fur family transcriptional regulator [Armatimonadota bacterium]
MNTEIEAHGSMLEPGQAVTMLKKCGARMTAQRYAVLDILHDNRTHPTAEMVIEQVRERLGCVSTATVYNTLETLEELGLIRRIDGLEQKAHFDPDTSNHQHALCRECRKVWDVERIDAINGLPDNFTVEDILIQGICTDCTKE